MAKSFRKRYLEKVFKASPVITLPSGQQFNLAKARERLVRLTAHKGLSTSQQREHLQRQVDAFKMVLTAIKMHKAGKSRQEIALRFEKHPDTIRNWLKGKLPDDFMTTKSYRRIRAHRTPINWKTVLSDQESRAKLAYSIGALFGNLTIHTDHYGHTFFTTMVSSHDFAARLADHLTHISGTKQQLKRKRTPQGNMVTAVRTNSVELVQFANKITDDQTKPPTRILKTDIDSQHFVKGYWDSRGHVSPQGRITLRLLEPQIKKTIEDYLTKTGIEFHYIKEGLIISPKSKQIFAEKIGFTDQQKNQRLQQT